MEGIFFVNSAGELMFDNRVDEPINLTALYNNMWKVTDTKIVEIDMTKADEVTSFAKVHFTDAVDLRRLLGGIIDSYFSVSGRNEDDLK